MNFTSGTKSRYRNHALLAAVSLAWLLVFAVLTQMPVQGIVYPDSASYYISADNLYNHFRGHNFRPVLMAALNGIPILFGGGRDEVLTFGVVVNVFCWVGSVMLVYEILMRFVSSRPAFWFSMASILIVGSTALVFHLLTETIYTFMVLMAMLMLALHDQNRRYVFLAVGLCILLLTMLIRPGGMVFAAIVALLYARHIWGNLFSRSQLWPVAALSLIMVQCAGMKYQFGNFTLSYIDAVTYYNYLGSKSQAFADGRAYSQERNPRNDDIYPLSGPEQKQRASADFGRQLQSHPEMMALAYLDNLLENTKTGSTPISDCRNVWGSPAYAAPMLFLLSKWQNRAFTIAGVLLGFWFLMRGKGLFTKVLAVYVLTTVFLSGISSSQGDRFHVVTFPVVLMMAALAWREWKGLAKRSVAPLQTG